MNKRLVTLLVIMSLSLVAADSGKKSRIWSQQNDLILLQIMLDLLGQEDWRTTTSPYTQALLLDINRLSRSPALKQFKDVIIEINKQSILSKTTMCSTPSSG